MSLLRRELTSAEPFDHDGEFYQVRGAYSSVRPPTATGIPLYFGGASAAAVDVGAEHADVYMLWGEPVAQIAERITRIRAAAARHGRSVRFSLSVRPIVADTEEAAWRRAEDIQVGHGAGRIAQAKTAQAQGAAGTPAAAAGCSASASPPLSGLSGFSGRARNETCTTSACGTA